MSHSNKNFANRSVAAFFLLVVVAFISCSPVSEPSSPEQQPQSSKKKSDVQLKATLSHGIVLSSGNGSKRDPFKVLIDESVSLERPSLALSEMFSNVASVGEDERGKVGAAQLDTTQLTVVPSLGSKLLIELKASNNEKKYAELYFQDSARLTKAVQKGEAVLAVGDRGEIANSGSTNADIVIVTLYKKYDANAGSVKPILLFDYDSDKFDVKAYENSDARFSLDSEIENFTEYSVAEEKTIQVVFEPKEELDKLLYPPRSQTLKIVMDEKKISSLTFNEGQWEGDNLSSGDFPEDARVFASVWNASLNLSSYVTKNESETLTVCLHKADSLNIVSSDGGAIAEGVALSSSEFAVNDGTKSEFVITDEPAFAIFEFSTPDNESENIVGKKLYVKVNLTPAVSIFEKADGAIAHLTAAASPGNGSEGSPYVFSVTRDQGVMLSTLTKSSAGDLIFAVKGVSDADFTTLTGSALRVSPGVLAAGNLAAGPWLLRIRDSGSIKYEPKELYFQLTFPLSSSSLALVDAYKDGGDGSERNPVKVTVPTTGIRLSSLTTPASTGKTLSYVVVAAGSGLDVEPITETELRIGETVGQETIKGGDSFVLRVSETADAYIEVTAFYFQLTFETPSLERNSSYVDRPGEGTSDNPIVVSEIAKNTSLILTDLIAPYSGTVTYSLERQNKDPITLPSNIPLVVGDEFGNSSEVTIAADTLWLIKVTGAPLSGETAETLYFQVTFARKSASLQVNSAQSGIDSSGGKDGSSEERAYTLTVESGVSLPLSSLTQNHAGVLSYNLDGAESDLANSVTTLQLGPGADTAAKVFVGSGERLIKVSDSGGTYGTSKSLYFKVIFTAAAASLKVDSTTYTIDQANGKNGLSAGTAYTLTVASNSSLTLADLTRDEAGDLTYRLDNANSDLANSVTTLQLGPGTDTAAKVFVGSGERLIKVSDSGGVYGTAKELYFKVIFTAAAASLKVDSTTYTIDQANGKNGLSAGTAYTLTVASNSSLTLADLTRDEAGDLTYRLDNADSDLANSVTTLQLGPGADTAAKVFVGSGERLIKVSDSGGIYGTSKSLYFKVIFTAAAASLKVDSTTYTIDQANGKNGLSAGTAYTLTVASNSSLTLADLTRDEAGDLTYRLDNAESDLASTVSTLQLGPGADTAAKVFVGSGERLIKVSDSGGIYGTAKELYFKVIFTAAAASLKVDSTTYTIDQANGKNGLSAGTAYTLTVASNSSLTLADLTRDEAGDLTYRLDNAESDLASTVSTLQLGPGADTAAKVFVGSGERLIKVSDSGGTYGTSKSLYFKVIFTAAAASLKVDSTTYTIDQANGKNGLSAGTAYTLTVASNSSLTLADLTRDEAGDLTYRLDNADSDLANSVTTLQLGPGADTAAKVFVGSGERLIKVSDSGGIYGTAKELYFKVIFTTAAASLQVNSAQSGIDSSGGKDGSSEERAYTLTVESGVSLSLSSLTQNHAGVLSYNLDDAESDLANSVTTLQLGPGTDTAAKVFVGSGERLIKVSDSGGTYGTSKSLYFKIIFTAAAASLKVDSTTYTIDQANGKNGLSAGTAYTLTVASNSSLTLADLTRDEAGDLTYRLDNAESDLASTVSTLQLGPGADTAAKVFVGSGERLIKVSDSGGTYGTSKSLYFKIIFTAAAASLKVDSTTYTIDQANGKNGLSAGTAYTLTVASNSSLTLADLTRDEAGDLTYRLDNAESDLANSVTTLQLGPGTDTAAKVFVGSGERLIKVSDSGGVYGTAKELYFKVIFTAAAASLKVDSTTYTIDQANGKNGLSAGTAYTLTVASNNSLTLADLTRDEAGDLTYRLDNADSDLANSVTTLQLGPGADTAAKVFVGSGERLIKVSDSGGTYGTSKSLYFKVIFTAAAASLKVDSTTYTIDQANGKNGLSAGTAYTLTVASNSSLTLADLTRDEAGDLSYNLDDAESDLANSVTTLQLGPGTDTAAKVFVGSGERLIKVSDSGGTYGTSKSLYFKIIFTAAAASLKVDSTTYTIDQANGKNGLSAGTAYTLTVASNSSLTLADLTRDEAGDLTYRLDNADSDLANSVTTLQLGPGTDTAAKVFVGSGERLIKVSDSGGVYGTAKELYFKVIFTAAAASLKVDSTTYTIDQANGKNGLSAGTAYTLTVASNSSLTLADLTRDEAGDLTYRLDNADSDLANSVTTLQLGPGADTAAKVFVGSGERLIKVSDSGGTYGTAKELYFKVIFTAAAASLKVDSTTYTIDQANGKNGLSAGTAYTLTVASNSSLTLADLTRDEAGDLTYRLDNADSDLANSVTTLQLGPGADTAAKVFVGSGERLIKVSDSGGAYGTSKNLYFKVTFTAAAASLQVNSAQSGIDSSGGKDGSSEERAYTLTVESGVSLPLSSLTQNNAGVLSYNLDGAESALASTVSALQLGPGADTAAKVFVGSGERLIKVSDSGGTYGTSKSLYFKVIFTAAAASLKVDSTTYTIDQANGKNGLSAGTAYTLTVASNSSLTLADLTRDEAGDLTYRLDNADSDLANSVTTLQLGPGADTAAKVFVGSGERLIKVSDSGGTYGTAKELYFKVIFTAAAASLKVDSTTYTIDQANGKNGLSAGTAYTLTVASNSSLTLADLTRDEAGDLTYRLDNADSDLANSVTTLQLGPGADTAAKVFVGSGERLIKVSDSGGAYGTSKNLYFKVTFTAAAASLKVDSTTYTIDQANGKNGLSAGTAYTLTVASNSSLTLADLTRDEAGDLTYRLDNADSDLANSVTTLQLGPGADTAAKVFVGSGERLIKVSDSGGTYGTAKELYFKVIFAAAAASLKVDSTTYTIDQANGKNGLSAGTAYTLTVASNSSLTLADLTRDEAGDLTYRLDNAESDLASTVSTLQLGPGADTAAKVFVGSGERLIKVSDSGGAYGTSKSLYFKVIFTAAAASLQVNSAQSGIDSSGGKDGSSEERAYTLTVASGVSLPLSSLTQNPAGVLSYNLDGAESDLASTVSALQLGPGADTAAKVFVGSGERLIKVSDSGGIYGTSKSLYFKVIFTAAAASLKVDSTTYTIDQANGKNGLSAGTAYTLTVASNSSLTLADLTRDEAGDLTYRLDNANSDLANSVTTLQLGPGADTAAKVFVGSGERLIKVSDSGGTYGTAKELYFKVIFTAAAASLKVDSTTYTIDQANGKNGLSAGTAYTLTVASNSSLTLADLTRDEAGDLTYRLDNAESDLASTVSTLQLGPGADTAAKVFVGSGERLIKVSDSGGAYGTSKSLYFKVIFTAAAASLQVNSAQSGIDSSGGKDGSSEERAYTLTVASGVSLPLSSLTQNPAGVLSYNLDGAESDLASTVSALQLGPGADTAAKVFVGSGERLIKVSDSGGTYGTSKSLYFKIIFTAAAASLKVDSTTYTIDQANGKNGLSAGTAYTLTVASNSSLTLADLTRDEAGDLTYRLDNANSDLANSVTTLQLGPGTDTAAKVFVGSGERLIKVSDSGGSYGTAKELYFKVIFTAAAASLKVDSTTYTIDQANGKNGLSAGTAYTLTVASNSSLTLADLTRDEAGDLTYRLDNAESDLASTVSTIQLGPGADTAAKVFVGSGERLIKVSDSGGAYGTSKSLYFKVIFTAAAASLQVNSAQSGIDSSGGKDGSSEERAYTLTVASGVSLPLSSLTQNPAGVLSYNLDGAESDLASTVSALQLGPGADTAAKVFVGSGERLIKVSDSGGIYGTSKSLYFKVIFTAAAASLKVDSTTYTIDQANGKNGLSAGTAYTLTVASNSSLTLADLTRDEAGDLTYRLDNANSDLANSVTTLQLGPGADTAAKVFVGSGERLIKVSDSGGTYGTAKELYFKVIFTAAAASLKVDSTTYTIDQANGKNGLSAGTAYTLTVASNSSLTLADLTRDEAGDLTYRLDNANSDLANSVTTLQLGPGADTAAKVFVGSGERLIKVSDSGGSYGTAKELYFKVIFTAAAASLQVNSAQSGIDSSGGKDGSSEERAYTLTVESGVSLPLSSLTQNPAGVLSYNLDGAESVLASTVSALQLGPGADTAAKVFVGSGERLIKVSDSGGAYGTSKSLYFKVDFLPSPSNFGLISPLPNSRVSSGNGQTYGTPFVISGIFTANTAVDLTSFVDDAVGSLTYAVLTSATDTGIVINSPESAIGDKAGESVVVRVVDSGSPTVAGKTLYLNLTFATVPPTADNRYTAAFPSGTGRTNGPEVALTGSMTAGEISFSAEFLPGDTDVVFYSARTGGEVALYYTNNRLRLYVARSVKNLGNQIINLADGTSFPAGVYNFTVRKVPSSNGYIVTFLVDGLLLNSGNTLEITTDFDVFLNPMIGADFYAGSRRQVRALNNVRWAFQTSAPLVSLFGGDDFRALAAGASVGSTFLVRVPNLVAGDTLELFSVVSAQTSLSLLETKTVAEGATSLDFVVTGLTHGTSYEFLVKKPATSSANLLDSPRSVAVTADTSVRETTAMFMGADSVPVTQNSLVNGFAGMVVTPAANNAFAVGDRIFLYEINVNNERVAVGSDTGLAHRFDNANFLEYSNSQSFPALGLDLSGIDFEDRSYNLVVEVVSVAGNKTDADFSLFPGETEDRVFNVTFDVTRPRLSFNFTDRSNLVISVDETLAEGAATAIQNGLTFTGTDANPTVSTVTDNVGSYTISLSSPLTAGAVLNLAAGTVTDVAGNGNVGVQQNVLPSLLSIVSSSERIGGDSSSTTLTFNFALEIDVATFSVADDLEIIDAGGTILTSNLLTFGSVLPASGSSKTVTVTLTAHSGFDAQVRVRMKTANEISLPSSSLTAEVRGQSGLIDIDRQAPTPTVSFATTEVGLSTAIEFTLSFDEAVTDTLESADFQVGTAANLADATATILSNIIRKDERTFTGTLTTPDSETAYSLILKANAVTDAYANANSASNAATINVVSTAVPIPSFSATPLPRHGGSTTLTISFPEAVTGFAANDLIVTDANSATNTVLLGTLSQTDNDYTVTLTTQNTAENTWTSGDVIVSVAANAYQNALNQGSSPALSYTVPVMSELAAPTLLSVTDGTTTVMSSNEPQTLLLSGISVNVNVAAVAGDTLGLFLGNNPVAVATQIITTTGTQSLTLSDTSSKVNGSRLAYSARLQDAQANNISESSNLLFVTFADDTAATPPEITGPVSNVAFADDFSSSATNWQWQEHNRGNEDIIDGRLRLTKRGVNYSYGLATQNDLLFSTQGKIVFEGTFIFGEGHSDGVTFFTYDAQDEIFHSGRTYSGNGQLVVTNRRLRSLFFAVGIYGTYGSVAYAAPATEAANFSNLSALSGGNENAFGRTVHRDPGGYLNSSRRLRLTFENQTIIAELAGFDNNGNLDESSWSEILNTNVTSESFYIPDNIKIGFAAAGGNNTNYHAIDDVSVDAQLFVPYQIGSEPVQAAPRGVALTAGKQAVNDNPLAIAGIRVKISSGYQAADNLVFSGDSALFNPILSENTLIVRAVTGETPTTAEFLAALNDIEFSAVVAGSRTLSWEVFAVDSGSEIRSQSYDSEIRVFPAS